jgi:preprotein translocase subunit SecB
MAEEAQVEKQFAIQKLYVKDVSFETPNSPVIFTENWQPKVEFNLSTNTQNLQENVYEVALTSTITVKLEEKTAYLIEMTQAGIFTIAGFDQEELAPMLGSFCPSVLFPYAREAVSDLVIRGGFPPMLLAPVNFDAIFMQHMQQLKEQQEAAESEAPVTLN